VQEKLQNLANLIFGRNDWFRGVVDATSREFFDRTYEHWLDRVRHLGAPFEWQSAINTATRLSSSWGEA
jgi:hypothetical protein